MKLTIRDLIRLRHCESHYRLGKLGLYAASKRTQFFYQKKDSLILALSKGPTSFSEALEKAFLEYSRDWFLNNRQYETCRDQDLARWHRFADWFFEQGYQILKTRLCSAISVNTSCNHVAVSELSAQADLVLKKGEHVYALSIFPNEPQYSVRARKQETQAYYSLELLSQYLISAPAYGQETISMICYLKSKEDKADFLASQYTEGKCYLQMGYGGIAEATQALLSTIQLSVPQKCEYCRYTDVCHQQNTSALAPEKQPEETSIPVPAETVDLEKGLTPEQRRVVEHMDGPMAVIAVPGAGKTHCLIARMVRMIKNGILPEQILFVTFTKKAAGEILERARRVLGEESALPAIFTFHSLGYTILRKHEDFIGKSLKIAEKVDYYRLILQIIDEISPLSGIDYDGLTGDFGLLSRIYNAVLSIEKDGLEEWKKHADFPDPDGLGCLYQKLKERMKEEGYICFDEQIQLTNQLFSEYPDVLKSYQQRFRYVMIDEFQDISSDQVDLVYAIASHGNIVVVGDDDQSIYSWRGGSNYYLLHFPTMKSLDADKKANKTSEAAPAAAEKVAEKVDFSNVKIEPIFEEMIDFDTFAKADYRAVKILECEAVPKSKKLLKFTLDDGTDRKRTILSGIHEFYEPEDLIGKTAIAIVNLPPRKMMGIDSEGMLISAVHEEDGHEGLNLLMVNDRIPAGAKLY